MGVYQKDGDMETQTHLVGSLPIEMHIQLVKADAACPTVRHRPAGHRRRRRFHDAGLPSTNERGPSDRYGSEEKG